MNFFGVCPFYPILSYLIESSHGGPNQWWNIHPARFPDQHQGGIHSSGSPARDLFSGDN